MYKAKKIKTFRRGARVRYIGQDPRCIEEWGRSIQTVEHKAGNMVVGYFPMRYADGSIHAYRYSMPIKDLEIVTD